MSIPTLGMGGGKLQTILVIRITEILMSNNEDIKRKSFLQSNKATQFSIHMKNIYLRPQKFNIFVEEIKKHLTQN